MEKHKLSNEIKVTVPEIIVSDLNESNNAECSPVFIPDKPSSRRVSFASSNFIKKFSIDPEKNTIWDSTYEEIINSDSTQSSENAHGTLSVQQTCILGVPQNEPKEGQSMSTSINFNLKGGEDIECDLTIFDNEIINKENTGMPLKSRKSFLAPSTQKTSPLQTRKENRTILNEVNMEITEQMISVNEVSCEQLDNRTYITDTSMEYTRLVIKENIQSVMNLNKTTLNNSNLEYTCQIPIESPTVEFDKTLGSDSMELTQRISINKLISEQSNATVLTHVNMEHSLPVDTCLFDKSNLQKSEGQLLGLNNSKGDSRVFKNTVADVVEMDLTTPVNVKLLNSVEYLQSANNKVQNVNHEHNLELGKSNMTINQSNKTVLGTTKKHIVHQPDIQEKSLQSNVKNKTNDESKCKRVLLNQTTSKKEEDKETLTKVVIDVADLKLNSQQNLPHSESNSNIFSTSKIVEEVDTLSSLKSNGKNSIVKYEGTEQQCKDRLPNSKNSSYANCLSLSSCTDDTQHLINYNLSNQQSKSDFSKIIAGDLNPSFINSKIMAFSSFSSDAFPVSLENTQEIKDCKSLGQSNKRSSEGEIPPAKKNNLSTPESCPFRKEKLEELHISQENLTLSDSVISNDSLSTLTHNVTNLVKLSEAKKQLIQNKELWLNYLKRNEDLESLFNEFNVKMEKLAIDAETTINLFKEQCAIEAQVISSSVKQWDVEEIESHSDFSNSGSFGTSTSNNIQDSLPFQTNIDLTLNSKTLTVVEQLKEKYEGSKRIVVENDSCKINTLFDTIQINVQFTKDNGIVDKMDIRSRISDDSKSIALLVHKIFIERLKETNIQSAVGDKYDILSLLDYIHLNMQKVFDILEEYKFFQRKYNCQMDKSFKAKFYIINLEITLCISVDMSDLDNISESSISFTAEIGTINQKEIKKFLNKSSKGLIFLKNFLKDVKTYVYCVYQNQM